MAKRLGVGHRQVFCGKENCACDCYRCVNVRNYRKTYEGGRLLADPCKAVCIKKNKGKK